MNKKKGPGVIYDLGSGRYGIAYLNEQRPEFKNVDRVFLHVFTDELCTVPQIDPKTKQNYSTLKMKERIKPIGFVD